MLCKFFIFKELNKITSLNINNNYSLFHKACFFKKFKPDYMQVDLMVMMSLFIGIVRCFNELLNS